MENRITQRRLKKDMGKWLLNTDSTAAFQPILDLPERISVSALISYFYDKNELVKWHAISAVGMVVNQLAQKNMESARVIMRRLMWTLNDESGGIGWGAPEAMGDIMARNLTIAHEYYHILLSYIIEDQNYLEHEMLQRGVLWAIGRLARSHPEYVKPEVVHLNPFMASKDPIHRGLALWAVFPLCEKDNFAHISKLTQDTSFFSLYGEDYTIKEISISELAVKAVSEFPQH